MGDWRIAWGMAQFFGALRQRLQRKLVALAPNLMLKFTKIGRKAHQLWRWDMSSSLAYGARTPVKY
jgi:hypothetical protein